MKLRRSSVRCDERRALSPIVVFWHDPVFPLAWARANRNAFTYLPIRSGLRHVRPAMATVAARMNLMQKKTGQKNQKCRNCEGKGTLKKGDKVVRCQRCGGSGIKW